MADLELMAGGRVSGSCSGGEGHGVLADDMCLMSDPSVRASR